LGKTRVSVAEVKMLLEFYDHDARHIEGLLSLARGANDSKLGAASPVLTLNPAELEAFLAGAKNGEFDHLV
jgi:hypothetical protein